MTLAFLILSLAVIAATLPVILSGAWLIRERTGNSGWIDATWTIGLQWFGWLAWPVIVIDRSGG